MKNSRMLIFIILVMVFVVRSPLASLAQSTPAGEPIELKLAHMFPVASPSHQHMEVWGKKIAGDSKGRLKIRIFPSNTLINAPNMYAGVVKGATDIGSAIRYLPEGYTIGVTFPFLLGAPDTITASRVYDDLWRKFPKVMAEEWKDVKILYLVPGVPQHLTTRKPLRRLEDVKGLQIRVPSKEMGSFIKELGAAPVFMSTADFVIGLEKGTVDGVTQSLGSIPDYKLGKTIRYVLMHSLGVPTPFMLIMNKDSYNHLPADLQKVIDNSCEWAKEGAIKYWSEEYENAIKYCKDEGIELAYPSREEKAKLVAIIERNRDKVGADLDAKGYPGTEIVRFIRERIEHYTK